MVQENGLLFVWAINSKYATAIQLIAKWGYEYFIYLRVNDRFVCDIAWVKLTPRGYIAQGNGFYLRHTKETCFVAKKVDEMLCSLMIRVIWIEWIRKNYPN